MQVFLKTRKCTLLTVKILKLFRWCKLILRNYGAAPFDGAGRRSTSGACLDCRQLFATAPASTALAPYGNPLALTQSKALTAKPPRTSSTTPESIPAVLHPKLFPHLSHLRPATLARHLRALLQTRYVVFESVSRILQPRSSTEHNRIFSWPSSVLTRYVQIADFITSQNLLCRNIWHCEASLAVFRQPLRS